MKCPYCQNIIDDDSRWCDQCGKELMFCPSCREPRKGRTCPRCGEMLVGADQFFGDAQKAAGGQKAAGDAGDAGPQLSQADIEAILQSAFAGKGNPFAGMAKQTGPAAAPATPTYGLRLSGSGMSLTVRDGVFGRRGGIFPELSSCGYVSGTHGELKFSAGQNCWTVRDLGSTNGTFIGGTRLEKDRWYVLQAGDSLRIATLDFTVEKA